MASAEGVVTAWHGIQAIVIDEALRQIDNKHYETEMRAAGIRKILNIGTIFRGKEISVTEG